MLKKILWLLVLAVVPAPAQTAAVQGHSFLGGVSAVTSGLKSSNYLNGIIPHATISVYYTGTPTLVPGNLIFSNATGTILGNPFTSNNATSVNPGGWLFFAATNQGYDIVASGGIAPNVYATPVTLCTDCFPSSQFVTPGVTQITAGTNITISPTSGLGNVTVNATGGGGGCSAGTCIVNNPPGTQTVTQPQGTTLQSNSFGNQFYANLFGTGSNGIATVYGNNADCLPQAPGASWGCAIDVPPLYTNADAPLGWLWGGNNFGNNTQATQMPAGASAYDYRNGTAAFFYHDAINPVTGQSGGLIVRNDGDQNLQTRNNLGHAGYGSPTGIMSSLNAYAGGFDFDFYPYMTQYVNQDYRYGLNLTQDNWTDGIDFGELEIMNHRGMGDALLHWERLTCDGGILAGNSEGCKAADTGVTEDPTVFRGGVDGSFAKGATSIFISCNQGCGTQGQDRLLVDTQTSIAGSFFTSEVGPQSTGSAGNSAIMPPQAIDTAATFPVSTMIQLCSPAANNGAGGAAGCTAGNQPTGVIPPTPLTISITAGSVTSNVGTFTGTNNVVSGQTVILYNFNGAGAPLNDLPATVLSAGLSSTGFEVSVTAANITSTGAGTSTQSPTGFSPAQSVVTNVVAPFTGTGGDTNGTPAGFCTSSNLQSSSSGSACYMPASGVGCLTDGVEYETDNYTYNSGTQQVTIANMMFPHLNGVVFATGGLCGYAVQDNANIAPSGVGATGTIAPTYAIAGSVSATSVYYIPQRTNEQYGSPLLGLSNPSNGNAGFGAQLYFSVASSSYSNSGGTVTFTMVNPPQVSGDLHAYNGLTVNFVTNGDASYNGNWPVTWLHDNVFSYQPTSPTGSVPTSGTITFNNASYTLYPAVRVASVLNPANHSVDGTFTLYPNTVTFGNGNYPVIEPHYQQLKVLGHQNTITQYSPEQYLAGGMETHIYAGLFQGKEPGMQVINIASAGYYRGYGGTHQIPTTGYELDGLWEDDWAITLAPDADVINITSCKAVGCSTANSSFNVLEMPALNSQNPQPGVNGKDVLNYDPNYASGSRSAGLQSGLWKFGNNPYPAIEENGSQSYTSVETGYYIADQNVTSPTINANNFFTSQLTSISGFTNVIGTPGSTTYNYWAVGHALAGGVTLPISFGGINTGNATLNGTNYNMICFPHQAGWASFDILKGSTATSIVTALSAITPNGLSVTPQQPANYSCFEDQGGSTTAYTAPTANTTGGVNAAGPIQGNSIINTSLIGHDGCGTWTNGVSGSTGVSCGGGGGGGGSVTSVSLTAPGWLTVAGSPVTTSGTIAISGTSEPANYVLATPNGSSGALSPRAIVGNDIPTLNQNTTGTAANLSGTPALPNGTTATTQAVGDATTKLATDAFVATAAARVADVTVSIATFAVPPNTCYGSAGSTTKATVTMTGLTTSMGVVPAYTADPSAIAGWGSVGGLNLTVWPDSANTAGYKVCNPTAASITGGAITLRFVAQ